MCVATHGLGMVQSHRHTTIAFPEDECPPNIRHNAWHYLSQMADDTENVGFEKTDYIGGKKVILKGPPELQDGLIEEFDAWFKDTFESVYYVYRDEFNRRVDENAPFSYDASQDFYTEPDR